MFNVNSVLIKVREDFDIKYKSILIVLIRFVGIIVSLEF